MDTTNRDPAEYRTQRQVALTLPAPMFEPVKALARARGLSRNALILVLLDRELTAWKAEKTADPP